MANPLFPTDDFKIFLASLLARGNLKEGYITKILADPENIKLFRKAWTHPSYVDDLNGNKESETTRDSESYDLLETYGDGSIAEFMVYYIRWRFPDLKSIKWVSRLKHTLVGGKMLGKLAIKEKMDRFARYGRAMAESMRKYPDLAKNKDYYSMMEDVLEAFCGALETIMTRDYSHGVFVEVIHAILRSFLANVEISLRYQDAFDAVTRLKELYESNKRGLKWPTNKKAGGCYTITKLDNGETKVSVYGWPKGDRKPEQRNRVLLATATEPIEKGAKETASYKALEVLESMYGIKDLGLDPYKTFTQPWRSEMGKKD
jgi:dsRNA-specific ribonuclease